MSLSRLLAALVALVLLGSTVACGKQQTTNARLREDTAAVVAALNAKDAPAARRALDVLDMDLAAAGRLGQLGDSTVSSLRAGVTKLRTDLALITPKVVVTPTATTRPATTPPRTRGGDEKGKGHKDD